MSLITYKKKRLFDSTPEPSGGKSKNTSLLFVVQKHAARNLHYDFRLEMKGVLKSWAVPKGPSTDPSLKRLAMMVEDHPFDYKDFEGVIPKGNYGAGSVIVWDQGTYEPIEPVKNKQEAEKLLLKELKSGSLKIHLHGKKLKGEYALVRTKGRGENSWLMIKHRDRYASDSDITTKNKSVVSGKTLEKISDPNRPVEKKNKELKKSLKNNEGVKAPFPNNISPMLATLVDQVPQTEDWQYEIKWDGYRAIAFCNKSKTELLSRNNKSFNEKFYPIFQALQKRKLQAVLDGEIVVLNNTGSSNFGSLQNWRSEADGDLIFYIFDLLWLNGRDLTGLKLFERREMLKKNIEEDGPIRISENFDTDPETFLKTAGEMGLEGIIAKKKDSTYQPGERNDSWLKIKIQKRHEVVIGGFTKNDDSPKSFSSLLVGVFNKGKLEYTGKIGTGFNTKQQKEMMKKFRPLITKNPPFSSTPDVNKPSRFRPDPPHAHATWLKPKLVCEVSYTEITRDGVMRHPSFQGMREDKNAYDVHPEIIKSTKEINTMATTNRNTRQKSSKSTLKIKRVPGLKPVADKTRKTLFNPSEETQVKKIDNNELKFTNLSKVYWPKEGFTKRDMLNYYYQVAPYILPYLKDRPQSLNRFPNGIEGKSFYQKDITATAPDWIKQFPYHTNGEDKNFLVVENEASLLWMANLGAIEMNPWNSTIQKPDNPDWCIIDIDPSEKNSFNQVIETALVTHNFLNGLKVNAYCKTSGSTGMHIYIPMGAKYSYDECQLFGRIIATHVQQELKSFTSIERMTDKRKGKIYVDFLQNRPKATLAAPYSLRPKPGATVSMPLEWTEIKKGLSMKDFTIENAVGRIRETGDLFKPVLGKGVDLKKILTDLK